MLVKRIKRLVSSRDKNIAGGLEFVKDGVLVGWVVNKREGPIDIKIYCDGAESQSEIRWVRRDDVAKKYGLKSIQCGFEITSNSDDCVFTENNIENGRVRIMANGLELRLFNKISSNKENFNVFVERSPYVAAAIDASYALGESGVLVFGWMHNIDVPLLEVYLCSEDACESVSGKLFRLHRGDVREKYNKKGVAVAGNCGFCFSSSIATNVGDTRHLKLLFDDGKEISISMPVAGGGSNSLDEVKEVFSRISLGNDAKLRLYDFFDNDIGSAVGCLVRNARERRSISVEEKQFGVPVKEPVASMIVPLYGRYDFLRYQLSDFARDNDFKNIDLIYVIDDPNIIAPTLDLAANMHGLLNISFRVIYYGANLGFAGANNVAVDCAWSKSLILLNSDILPQSNGWVRVLLSMLDELPDAGMVAPMLQYYDNSIQHIGMVPYENEKMPGFIFNKHISKGLVWEGNENPVQNVMLTAACIVLKKDDFHSVGGFDEGYAIGDFEDSDLCMAIARLGKKMWLVPEVKLWHLERQSQNIDSELGVRQLITFYNSWRYKKKILANQICNPFELEVE